MLLVGIVASLACVFMLGQNAFGFEQKTSFSKFSLVTLAGCTTHYLVENCDTSQNTIKRVKSTTINLTETLSVDTKDKKPKDAKQTKEKKSEKTTEKTKKSDDKKKKIKELKEKLKKIKEKSKTNTDKQKTNQSTIKNSTSNIK
jgi:outer membrane biosynthesis protein TonB